MRVEDATAGVHREAKRAGVAPRGAGIPIEKFLRIPDGSNAGQPLILAPWQRQEIHRIYDYRVRRAIISTPKKNGKTGLCAALLLNHLVGPSARDHRSAAVFVGDVEGPGGADLRCRAR